MKAIVYSMTTDLVADRFGVSEELHNSVESRRDEGRIVLRNASFKNDDVVFFEENSKAASLAEKVDIAAMKQHLSASFKYEGRSAELEWA